MLGFGDLLLGRRAPLVHRGRELLCVGGLLFRLLELRLHLEHPLGGDARALGRLLGLLVGGGGLALGRDDLALGVGDQLVDPLGVGPGAGSVAGQRDVRVPLGQAALEPQDGGGELLALGLRGAQLEVELLERGGGGGGARCGRDGRLELAQPLLGLARRALRAVGAGEHVADVLVLGPATVPEPAFSRRGVLDARRRLPEPSDEHDDDADQEQEDDDLQRAPDAVRLVVDRRVALVDLHDAVDRAGLRQRDGDEGLEELLVRSPEPVVVRAVAGEDAHGLPVERMTDPLVVGRDDARVVPLGGRVDQRPVHAPGSERS